MPYFIFPSKPDNRDSFIQDLLTRKSQIDVDPTASLEHEHDSPTSSITNTGKSSCFTTPPSNYANLPDYLKQRFDCYANLPDYLKHCLDYCCISIMRSIDKGKLVRLLMAEGLVQENPGELLMEDIAANIITELIGLGMLQKVLDADDNELEVSSLYRGFSLIKLEKQDFVNRAANRPLHVVIRDNGKGINPNMKSLVIRSLFVTTGARCSSSSSGPTKGLSRASMETICGFQFLLVLDLDGEIEYLPNEVGDLVHLRYLGLENSELNELPQTLGNLQKLQTLDIRMCGNINELPKEVLNIRQLRHLLMSRCIGSREIRVPKGIRALVYLRTCTGVYAGCGIASELSTLTQLRELGVMCVSEDHARELSTAITKMENLISLSLEAEEADYEDEPFSLFPVEFEPFTPPLLLQELYLHGGLAEWPIWLASMSNLTILNLSRSNLQDSPTSVLQFLPKLKHLTLWDCFKAKQIGKEFCQAGGFPELQTLTIASSYLVDWTEIVNGAFPRLRSLQFRNCLKLRFIPDGLQDISSLEYLSLSPLHGDLARRLKNEENYKLKHISKLSALYQYQKPPWKIYTRSPQEVLQLA